MHNTCYEPDITLLKEIHSVQPLWYMRYLHMVVGVALEHYQKYLTYLPVYIEALPTWKNILWRSETCEIMI